MTDMMPDLSHLTEEERKIIEEVLQRQKAEENKEQQVQQQYEKELDEIERQINERKENALRLIGTQDDAICQICQKTKFADGIGHKCYYCQLRSCARCGGRMQIKVKSDQAKTPAGAPTKPQPQKTIWACSLCQKRQQIMGKTGKWFHKEAGMGVGGGSRATTPTSLSPSGTPTLPSAAPTSTVGRTTPSSVQSNGAPGSMGSVKPAPFTLQQPQPPSQHQHQHQQQQPQQLSPARSAGAPNQQGQTQSVDRQHQRSPSPQSGYQPAPYQDQRQQQSDRQSPAQPPRSRQDTDRRRPSVEVERQDRRREDFPRATSPGVSPANDRQTPGEPQRERRRSSHQHIQPIRTAVVDEPSTASDGARRRPSEAHDYRYPVDQAPTPPTSIPGDKDSRRRSSRERWPSPPSQRRDSRGYCDENTPDIRSEPPPSKSHVRSETQRSRSPPQYRQGSTGDVSPSTSRRSLREEHRGYNEEPVSPRSQRSRSPQEHRPQPRPRSRDHIADEEERTRSREMDYDGRTADRRGRNGEERGRDSGAGDGYTYDTREPRAPSMRQEEYNERDAGRTSPEQIPLGRREGGREASGRSSPIRQEEHPEERYDPVRRSAPPHPDIQPRPRDSFRGDRRAPSDQRRAPIDEDIEPRRMPVDDYAQQSHRKVLPTVGPPYEEDTRTHRSSSSHRNHGRPYAEPRSHERRRLPEPVDVLRAGAAGQQAQPGSASSHRTAHHSPRTARQLEAAGSAYRQDSLSSDPEMHKPGPPAGGPPRASPTSARYHGERHHPHSRSHYAVSGGPGGTKPGHSQRTFRISHHKQRSFSSSDDEVASTSGCPSCEEMESEPYPERGGGALPGREKYSVRFPVTAATFPPSVVDAELLAASRQLSVTWQPSADGQRMIGHMILRRPSGASLGLKVVGGRPTASGRLGAFVTKVKRGSVAEVVGHLKPGDEVLEWNGLELQNASFDEVCDIINESKHDPQVELIVSRSLAGIPLEYDVKGSSVKYLSSAVGSSPHSQYDTRVDATGNTADWETTLDDSVFDEDIDQASAERRTSNATAWTRTSAATTMTNRGCESLKAMLACTRRTFMFCPICCADRENEAMHDMVSRADTMSLHKQAQFTSSPAVGSVSSVVTVQPSSATAAYLPGQTPVVMITAPAMNAGEPVVVVPSPGSVMRTSAAPQQQAKGQIFGRIQIALFYSPADQQLVITVYQAADLPSRNEGTARNPYVKMFLLPDRSEKSRRQTKTLASTCQPTWQQSFIYQNVTQMDLSARVLEVTLWDYDKYATNEFLGEVLFDLASTLLDNEPRWYTLTDMDEESPIRLKLRHLRLSAYTNQQPRQTSTAVTSAQANYADPTGILQAGTDPLGEDLPHGRRSSMPYRTDARVGFADQPSEQPAGITRSQTYYRPRHPEVVNQDEMEDMYSGYYSDHGHRSRALRRFPRAAGVGGMKAVLVSGESYDLETGGRGEEGDLVYDQDGNVIASSRRHLPRVPADIYGEEAMRELGDKAQQLRSQGLPARRHHSARTHRPAVPNMAAANMHRRNHQRLHCDPLSPPNDQAFPGYMSDGSETSMSITSTQSERPRTRTHQEFQNSLEAAPEETEPYDGQDGTMSDSAVGAPICPSNKTVGFAADAKRKKSIMTRLIPGRAGSALTLAEQRKQRMGFTRSEEIGVPSALASPPSRLVRDGIRPPLIEQASMESQGSVSSESSLWLPIVPGDGPLGEFIAGLGQGQVVGRQALASPCLGEIQLVIAHGNGNLEVKVIRARNLIKKPGAKYNPAPYVKVYLVEGKYCIAKAKTTVAARTAEPRFDQHLVFNETFRGRLLQVSVWGDYGRMERKVFMGIALIRLDYLEQHARMEGWYKLYHSSSLVGTSSPARKESQPVYSGDQAAPGGVSHANQNSTVMSR